MNKIKILKLADFFFGTVACRMLSSPSVLHTDAQTISVSKILVIRPGGIGDAVLLCPLLIELRRIYPGAVIHVLAEKRNYSVFSLFTAIDKVLLYDKPAGLFAAIKGRYDIVIDSEQWHRLSAMIARMTRAPMLIGYATNERKRLFTHTVVYSQHDYEVNSFLKLLKPIAGETSVDMTRPFLHIPRSLPDNATSFLRPLAGKKIIALFPGGSIKERRWGSKKFHELARKLIEVGYGIVIVGGKDNIREGMITAQGLPDAVNLSGKLPLTETAAVLRHVFLLITGDSGIMHIGFGLGIKTLSFFGPGIEEKWAPPRSLGHVVLNKNLGCSPCTKFGYTPRCKRDAECMKRITVDEVVQKTLEMLEG